MFDAASDSSLELMVDQTAALIAAATHTLMALVGEVDARGLWRLDGARDVVEWVQLRTGVDRRSARRLVETASGLQSEPALAAAFAAGSVSFDQTAEALKLTDRWSGQALVDVARIHSPAALRRLGAAKRPPVDRSERRFSWGWVDGGRALRLSGRLPAADGQYVAAALERLRDEVPPDPETGRYQPAVQRGADALVELCSLSLEAAPEPDRATVVVHVDATTLDGETDQGAALAPDVVDRMLCDGHLAPLVEDDWRPVGIGRRSRQIPHWLRRALFSRDRTCQFPGCWRTRWTHAHHLVEWTNGGPTDLDNLLRLCGFHHRAVHQGIRIEIDPDGVPHFYRRDGVRRKRRKEERHRRSSTDRRSAITLGTDPLQDRLRDRFIGGPAPP